MIPKYIHIFWDNLENIPFIVKKCIKNIKEKNKDFKVILYSEKDLPFELYKNTYKPFISDIFRLYILYKKGGVYLDASVLCINNIKCVFDLNDNRLQGYETPWGGMNIENPIMCCAPKNMFVYKWLKQCLLVNKTGTKKYIEINKKYINTELEKHLPYLVNFLAYNVAFIKMFDFKTRENKYIKLLSKSIDINGPLYHMIINDKNTEKAVNYLLYSEHLINQNCLIKLRSGERRLVSKMIREKKYNKKSFIIKLLKIK